MTLGDLFKYDFLFSRAAVDKISTDRASRGPSATAEVLVWLKAKFHYAVWFDAGRRQVRSWSANQLRTS